MIDWWSFILGVIIGLAGMIIEAFAWRVSWQEDREIFDGQIRRRERIIDALITEVTRLKEEKRDDAGRGSSGPVKPGRGSAGEAGGAPEERWITPRDR